MTEPSTNAQTLRGGVVIAIAMGVMNVTTYGFTILAARLLGPSNYGALAAMMGLLLVVNVLSLGLQATAARRVSAAPQQSSAIERDILSVSNRYGLVLAALCLVASPAITIALHLDDWLTAAMLAVTVIPLTIMGGQAGVLQGERRWTALAAIYLTAGLGRLLSGFVALLIAPTALGAMTGVAIGAFFPAVVGWLALRHQTRVADHAGRTHEDNHPPVTGRLLREVSHNSHALLAFFALCNADVVVARITLDQHQAGLYAGGLIMAKAVLFLPQFVVVIVFPSMAAGTRRNLRRKSLALVFAIGLCAVVGAAVLSSLAVIFVGGDQYSQLHSTLWAFAGLGTLLAMIQLMVYDVVARQHQRAVFVIWGALLVLLCSIPFVNTENALLSVVVTIDFALLVVILLVSLRKPAPTAATAAPGTGPPIS